MVFITANEIQLEYLSTMIYYPNFVLSGGPTNMAYLSHIRQSKCFLKCSHSAPPPPLPPCLALSPLYCVVTSLRPVPHFDFSMASLKTFNTGCDFGGPSPTVHPSLHPLPFLFPDHFLLWAASSKLSSSLSSVPLLLLDRVKNELRYC